MKQLLLAVILLWALVSAADAGALEEGHAIGTPSGDARSMELHPDDVVRVTARVRDESVEGSVVKLEEDKIWVRSSADGRLWRFSLSQLRKLEIRVDGQWQVVPLPADLEAEELLRSAKHLVYLELLGNGLIYSVNYERFFRNRWSMRVGAEYLAWEDEEPSESWAATFWLLMLNYLKSKGNSHLEMGFGLTMVIARQLDGPDEENLVYPTGTLGYRYQRPDGGLVFRAGLTPLYYHPFLGVSLGYAF